MTINTYWICLACDKRFDKPVFDYAGFTRCPICDSRAILFEFHEVEEDFSI